MSEIIRVDRANWFQYRTLCENAMELYIEIFSQDPYNEHFEMTQVRCEFEEYIKHGCFLIAVKERTLVGFLGASIGINHLCSEEFIRNTEKYGKFNYKNDIYISELGVSNKHRGLRIGTNLVNTFMEIYKYKGIFLRTGVNNNENVIKMYEKRGFCITDMREIVKNMRMDGKISEDERLYMYRPPPPPPTPPIPLHICDNHILHRQNNSDSEHWYGRGDESDEGEDGHTSGAEAFYG